MVPLGLLDYGGLEVKRASAECLGRHSQILKGGSLNDACGDSHACSSPQYHRTKATQGCLASRRLLIFQQDSYPLESGGFAQLS